MSKFLSIPFLLLLTTSCSYEILDKIKTIEIGMTKSKVLEVLGEPDLVYNYEESGVKYTVMKYPHPLRNASTFPTVILCQDIEVVVRVIVDDSGGYDKESNMPNLCSSLSDTQVRESK